MEHKGSVARLSTVTAVKTEWATVLSWLVEDQMLTGGWIAGRVSPVVLQAVFARCGNVPRWGVPAMFTPCWIVTNWCLNYCSARSYPLAVPSSLLHSWWADRARRQEWGWRRCWLDRARKSHVAWSPRYSTSTDGHLLGVCILKECTTSIFRVSAIYASLRKSYQSQSDIFFHNITSASTWVNSVTQKTQAVYSSKTS